MQADINGVWRTVGGRRIFIKTGQSLSDAMIKSGKYKSIESKSSNKKYEKLDTFEKQLDYIMENQNDLFNIIENDNKNRLYSTYKSEIEYLAKRNNFDGKPELLNKNDFEKLSNSDYIKVYRGMLGENYIDQFKNGEYEFGNGEIKRGVGHYSIINKKDAEVYGTTIEIAIPRNAKIIEYSDLYEEHYKNFMKYTDNMEEYYTKYGDKVTTIFYDFNDNISTTAMFNNYDVIKDDDMYIILNRSIIKIKE